MGPAEKDLHFSPKSEKGVPTLTPSLSSSPVPCTGIGPAQPVVKAYPGAQGGDSGVARPHIWRQSLHDGR